MMTGPRTKAARALPGIDQGDLAGLSRVSLWTLRRMEPTPGIVRADVDTQMQVVDALDGAGRVPIDTDLSTVEGGRGIRLERHD